MAAANSKNQVDSEEYELKPTIKNAVQFKRHNLLTDSPVSDCHLILCRNVFIYFQQETQEFLLNRFSQSLRPAGYLVIGSAEYISRPENRSAIIRFLKKK